MDTQPASFLWFANHFPVYFRAPVLLALVWILWGVNIWVFKLFHINYGELLNFDPATTLTARQVITSGLAFVGLVGIVCLAFLYQVPFKDVLIFPSVLYLTMAFCLVIPMNVLHRPGREKLLHNLSRVFFPASTGVLFVEVLLGDVLTSISKVMADVEVTGCVLAAHMVTPKEVGMPLHDPSEAQTSYSFHEAECADSWMRPLVTSIPFLLRFRQCWVQYRVTGRAFPNLMNCAKYLSSLPVIWISAFTQQEGHFSKELRAAWIFAVSFNSFFSFMWDIVMDWGLCRQGAKHFLLREYLVFESCGNPVETPRGSGSGMGLGGGSGAGSSGGNGDEDDVNEFDKLVRQVAMNEKVYESNGGGATGGAWCYFSNLMGGGHVIYYLAMMLNFVLRILWSFKLSVHFQLSQEGLTFVLEVCEVFRRFVWILFRVEWEAVEKGGAALSSASALMNANHAGGAAVGGSRPGSMGILVVDDKPDVLMFREKKSPKPVPHNGSTSVTGSATRARLDWGPASGRDLS